MNPTKFLICLFAFFCITQTFKMTHQSIEQTPQEDCNNITNFDFMSIDYMAKNTYMNRTLAYIKQQRPIYMYGVEWKLNETDTYTISSCKMNITWIDQNQTSSWGQNEAILIEGGKFEVNIQFDWYHKKSNGGTNISGKATAYGRSRQVPFTVNIHRQSGLPSISWTGFELGQVMNITFPEIPITSASCKYQSDYRNGAEDCEVTDEDKFILNYLIYKAPANLSTLKSQLELKLNQLVKEYLAVFVCCENSPTYGGFTYKIQDPYDRRNFTVSVGKENISILVDKTGPKPGIYSRYRAIINSTSGSCGPVPANSTLDTKIFGGGQEFIAFTVFSNLLKIGLSAGKLDTYLFKTTWSTKSFKFTIGELSDFLSNINSTFSPSTSIYGICESDRQNFKISKGTTNSTVKVLTNPSCYLKSENDTKIIAFKINLTSIVYPVFMGQKFDVWMKSFTFDVNYDDSFGFKLTNKTLADQIMKDSLERLYEVPLFGSGWPYFLSQKNPALYVTETALLIYDRPQ